MSQAQIRIAEEQIDLLTAHTLRPAPEFGATYDAARDGLRVGKIGLHIFKLLCDGQPWTLPQFLEKGVEGLTSTHSARIRQIRDWLEGKGWGTIHDIPPVGTGGLWKYVLVRGPGPYPERGQKARFAKTLPANRDISKEWPIAGVHYRSADHAAK